MIEEVRDIGRFRLVRPIGRDAVGEIYQAEMIGTVDYVKQVSVKLLYPWLAEDANNLSQLFVESEAAARLQSSKIAMVYESGLKQGYPYLAVEHLEGWTLQELIELCRKTGRRFPVPAAVYVVSELCSALRHLQAHREGGIVHGCITPGQVFVSRTGRVKLGDYCTAHLILRAVGQPNELPDPLLPYLAPEQARGEQVSGRTDVYALGLILFELLTGCRLNAGVSRAALLSAAANPVELVPSNIVDDAAPLDGAVSVALKRAPEDRSSADGLGSRLSILLGHHTFDGESMARFCAAAEHLAAGRARALEDSSPSGIRPAASISRSSVGRSSVSSAGSGPALLSAGSGASGSVRPATRHVRAAGVSPVPSPLPLPLSAVADPPDPGGSRVAIAVTPISPGRYARRPMSQGPAAVDVGPPEPDAEQAFWDSETDVTEIARPSSGWGWLFLGAGMTTLVLALGVVYSVRVGGTHVAASGGEPARVQPRASSPSQSAPAAVPEPEKPTTAPTLVVTVDEDEGVDAGEADSRAVSARRVSEEPARSLAPKASERPTPTPDPQLSLQQKEARQLVRQARLRGLFAGDDPSFDHWRGRALADSGQGGERALRELRILVEDFVLDRAFVVRKLARLQRAIGGATGDRAARLRNEYLTVERLTNDGELQRASALISQLLGRR